MSGTYDRARRYCDRANECIQIIASSQTPGTGTIHLLIAEHYLRLAASEKTKESNRSQQSPDRRNRWKFQHLAVESHPILRKSHAELSTEHTFGMFETCIERFSHKAKRTF